MIIESSGIAMSGSRKYASRTRSSQSLETWGRKSGATGTSSSSDEQTIYRATDKNNQKNNHKNNDLLEQFRANQNVGSAMRIQSADRLQNLTKIRQQSINYLLDLLLGRSSRMYDSSDLISLDSLPSYGGTYTSEFYYSEQETTSFSTEGTVKTSDGREINFQVDLTMSRSFTQYISQKVDFGSPKLVDPLVINLDAPAADVQDQKFYFDLDADGHEEAISQLGPGSGFLALDKNGDGIINDGSELFGALSGNGFEELAKYDSDGNGWIDEADEIFDKLLIWSKDANGKDVLVGLGKAGVGAIYLGSQKTDFSMNNSKNQTNAIVRQTGMFLYENGGVGTMQQLDLAT